MTLPLDGILVADFSRVLAGPYATSMLSDLGARVIKVEQPGRGDDTRSWGPPWTENSASYFEAANRGKESVVLNLKDAADLKLAQELAARADVIVENFRPGTLDRFALSYAQLSATNPKAVYCSISGFGSGPGSNLPGYDFIVQATGGLMSITGEPESEGGVAMKVGVALVDILTAKDATIGILAALAARTMTGRGQHIEVNLLSSLLAGLANQASSYLTTGESPRRRGNEHPSIAPYELLPCADGQIAIACGNDGQFRKLARVLGDETLADDERFALNAARVQHRELLADALTSLLAQRSAAAWVSALLAEGIPAGEVGSIADGFALATELGLDPIVDVGSGRPAQVRHPIIYSATPVTHYTAPPRLGEHNDAVRKWLEQEISQ